MDDNTALGFNTICNFIRDLNGSFGTKQKSLMLYGHLIEKTGLIHIEPVKKHLQIFQVFVQENEEAIMDRDRSKLKMGRIVYSDRVAIDLQAIFKVCDREEEAVIWTHLLTISAILRPEGRAKQVLQDMKKKPVAAANPFASLFGAAGAGAAGSDGGGDNFIKNIMDKIGEQVQESTENGEELNPMKMIGTMMSSGVFNEIFQGLSGSMENGEMDIGKLMGSMQAMMSSMNSMMKETMPVPATQQTEAISEAKDDQEKI